jgi:Transglutaminase-like superfamily
MSASAREAAAARPVDGGSGRRGGMRDTLCVVPIQPLSPLQKAFVVGEILVAYVRARRWLARKDLGAVVAEIRSRPPVRPAGIEPLSTQARAVCMRLGNAVVRTLRVLPTDSRCLSQSLVLMQLLAARQIDATLVIGARSDPDFAAHAWVEHRGKCVLNAEDYLDARLLEV